MSLLAPLYVLGTLAVALPVLFHLIRRQVKDRTPISTIMFLPTSQPRLTRRSRLENLPLLLLRALALILLALAFSRPFLRSTSTAPSDAVNRRVVVLVDTSASMRRGDLWDQALAQLADVTENLRPGDSIAVVSFDAEPTLRIGFEAAEQLPPASLRNLGQRLFAGEQPSWYATDLAAALRFAAELATAQESGSSVEPAAAELAADEERVAGPAQVESQLVLISDLQAGASLDSLQGFAWPQEVPVEIRRLTPPHRSNAWITLPRERLASAAAGEAAGAAGAARTFRLRVSNAADSLHSQFRLNWLTATGTSTPENIQVAPGQSRIVHVAQPPDGAIAIALSGDDHDFDNLRYYAQDPPVEQTLLFVGDDPAEPRESLLYYLQRISLNTPAREVVVQQHTAQDGPLDELDQERVGLIVAAGQLDAQAVEPLRRYVRGGGRLVYVLPPAGDNGLAEDSLRLLSGDDELRVSEANVQDYAMLSRIDFTDPLFLPLSDPKFNDFSKIRFWAHRTVDVAPQQWKTLASFDDGSPALLERADGAGRIWVFTAGWQPVESQLALSTKFIPLVFGLFDAAGGNAVTAAPLTLGGAVPDADGTVSPSVVRLAESAGEQEQVIESERIERPGVYQFRGERVTTAAVNLADSESRTEPLGDDELERMGVILGTAVSDEMLAQTQRQLRDVELESQQRLWQWLLLGVLGLLALETWLGGWLGRRRRARAASEPAVAGS